MGDTTPNRKCKRKRKHALPLQRSHRRIPQLPEDIIARIMRHADVRDLMKSRLVCRAWRRAIEGHSIDIWEPRLSALELLPPSETNSVLGRSADVLRSRVKKARSKENSASKVFKLYIRYFFVWKRHICLSCGPDVSSLRNCCTKPSNFRWLSSDDAQNAYSDIIRQTGVEVTAYMFFVYDYYVVESIRFVDEAGIYMFTDDFRGMMREYFRADGNMRESDKVMYVRYEDVKFRAMEVAVEALSGNVDDEYFPIVS